MYNCVEGKSEREEVPISSEDSDLKGLESSGEDLWEAFSVWEVEESMNLCMKISEDFDFLLEELAKFCKDNDQVEVLRNFFVNSFMLFQFVLSSEEMFKEFVFNSSDNKRNLHIWVIFLKEIKQSLENGKEVKSFLDELNGRYDNGEYEIEVERMLNLFREKCKID